MYSMVDSYSEMGQIAQDYHFYTDHNMEKIKLDHVTQVIGYHPKYLEHFLRTQNFIMYGDGPLPYNYRHYLAIMAAARHRCTYLVELFEREFIDCGGDETWLQGLEFIPPKLLAICEINKILAHRPWLLTPEHIAALAKANKYAWTVSELVHAIVILSHIHSLSSFVFSCGLTQELENASPIIPPPVGNGVSQSSSGTSPGSASPGINGPTNLSTSPNTAAAQKKAVDVLMAKMLNLSQQNNECSEDELIDRFKNVEMQTAELSPTAGNSPLQLSLPINVLQYIDDPGYTYVDFARRGHTDIPPTFRVQDYSWDDHGYSLVNRLYNDVGYLLDVKFRATYNLTYCTMAGRTNVDTSKFRRAIWNYIQCIYGIRHDDYDYGEVNQLLERPLKMFIKTACCFPERITKSDYDSILKELQHSEKVHVNLMILEARNQAELLYALRAIMRYMT